MNKTKKVICKSAFVILGLVGVLNLVGSIFLADRSVAAKPEPPYNSFTASATIKPSSTMSLSADSVALDIVPSEDGTFKSDYLTVSTYTNTSATCTVVMVTNSSSLTSGANTIDSLSSATSEANFVNDRWGYRPGSTGNFNPVSSSANNPITSYSQATGTTAQTIDVYFGAKLTAATKPGTYSTTVNFTSTCVGGGTSVASNYMQDQTEYTMQALLPNIGDTVTLIDRRDNTQYVIGKLDDGNYWMLDNLALDLTNATVQSKLTSSTTNASDATLNYLVNGGGTTSDQYATSGVSSTWTDSYSDPRINMASKNTIPSGATAGSKGSNKVGGYYNFCAASAGSYCYGDGATTGTSVGNATEDICPKGWRMPTGFNSGEYKALAQAITNIITGGYSGANATAIKSALSTPLSGYFEGSAGGQGLSGFFWSSTREYDDIMSRLMVLPTQVYPNDGIDRYSGNSVRCLFSATADIPRSMQEQTSSTLARLLPNMGSTTTLFDSRDGKPYTVKKINGQYWMTQNLRFTNTSVPAATSNVDSDVTLTYYSLKSSDNGGFGAYTGHCEYTNTNSYNNACIYDSGSTTTGVWYNYYAATAGTISTDSNSTAATSDICPAGWHLPTGPNTTANTNLNILVGNTTSGAQDPTAGLTAFSAVAGGNYVNGSLFFTERGFWWSATAVTATVRYGLDYTSSTGQFTGSSLSNRNYGLFIRCMRS